MPRDLSSSSAVEYGILMEGCVVEGVARLEESIIGRKARLSWDGRTVRFNMLGLNSQSCLTMSKFF